MSLTVTPSMQRLVREMKIHAESGMWRGGRLYTPYFEAARRVHQSTGTFLIYTRDCDMHASGWFKNPDYDRCYHLSLSFWDLSLDHPRPFERRLARTWIGLFYGKWTRYIWEEGPTDEHQARMRLGLAPEVRHYRVVCDPAWQPIVPRGEVYTREFIERGWLSWSDQQYRKGR